MKSDLFSASQSYGVHIAPPVNPVDAQLQRAALLAIARALGTTRSGPLAWWVALWCAPLGDATVRDISSRMQILPRYVEHKRQAIGVPPLAKPFRHARLLRVQVLRESGLSLRDIASIVGDNQVKTLRIAASLYGVSLRPTKRVDQCPDHIDRHIGRVVQEYVRTYVAGVSHEWRRWEPFPAPKAVRLASLSVQ